MGTHNYNIYKEESYKGDTAKFLWREILQCVEYKWKSNGRSGNWAKPSLKKNCNLDKSIPQTVWAQVWRDRELTFIECSQRIIQIESQLD